MRHATYLEQKQIEEILKQDCRRSDHTGLWQYAPGMSDQSVARRVSPDLSPSSVGKMREQLGMRLRAQRVAKTPQIPDDKEQQTAALWRENGLLRKQLLMLTRRVDVLEGRPSLKLAEG